MRKSIVVCIILSIVTCGIYALYWMTCINNIACRLNPKEWNTDGFLVVLFSIITCGIYTIFWNYKMGRALMVISRTDRSVLYVLLSLFGLAIVSMAIMQDDLNQMELPPHLY